MWIAITSGRRSRRECIDALELAADMPGTTRTAKSQRSRIAVLNRQRPDVELVTLMPRGCVGPLSLLMPSMMGEEKQLSKQVQRVAKLLRKNREGVGGVYV